MKLVSQQYRAWSDCMDVRDGLALYWWQRHTTFGVGRIRVNFIKRFIIIQVTQNCMLYHAYGESRQIAVLFVFVELLNFVCLNIIDFI